MGMYKRWQHLVLEHYGLGKERQLQLLSLSWRCGTGCNCQMTNPRPTLLHFLVEARLRTMGFAFSGIDTMRAAYIGRVSIIYKHCCEAVNVQFSLAACNFGHTETVKRCSDCLYYWHIQSIVHWPHLTHCAMQPCRNVAPTSNCVYSVHIF